MARQTWPTRWQTGLTLCLGALLGVGATLGGQAILASGPPVPPVKAVSRPVALALPEKPAAPSDDNTQPPVPKSKDARLRGATDWERVAAQLATPGSDTSFARSLMLRLDGKALRKLAANVATWPRGRRNQRILGQIFHRWGELDPQAAITQAQALPPDLAYSTVREAIDGYAESDPAGASAYLAAPPPAGTANYLRGDWFRSIRLGQALQNWAEQDAAAAVGFASRLPPDAYRSYALDDIAQEWMRQDPTAALNWAQSLDISKQRTNALDGIVTTWAQTDPTVAANYVLGLSGNPSQNDLLKTLADHWSERDPAAAARWVAAQSGDIQAKSAGAVAETWANLDPQAAAAWSNQFPAGDTRNEAWSAIAKAWYVNDPAATQSWLNSLPTGEGRDSAIIGATAYWNLRNQPTEILGMVQGISDPQARANTLAGVLNTWLGSDHAAAQQWIGQANLPEAVTGKLKGG